MSAPRILKTTAPKGAIVVNIFSPSLDVELQMVIRRPWNRRKQMQKIRQLRETFSTFTDWEIVPTII